MTDTEQPSQWARELASDWNYECRRCSEYEGDFEADFAEALQRAFAEREAELVADNAKLREASKAIDNIVASNLRGNVGPDRVRWDGVWYEGPMATAYLQTILAFQELARQALAQQDTTDAK